MSDLTELLDRAVGVIEQRVDVPAIEARAVRYRRQRRSRRVALVVAVVVVVTSSVLAVALSRDVSRVSVKPPAASLPSSGVFPDATGTVLIFDDGYDGITLVDLDHRVAARRTVVGQRAGDQPYRLLRVGDSLVVGWSPVYVAPLDGAASRQLGTATLAIPAAEPGLVWLVDYSPCLAICSDTPMMREVDLAGNVVIEARGLVTQGAPVIGIPGGVAYQTTNGIVLWDARTGMVTERLGGDPTAQTLDIHSDDLAWCESRCQVLHISNLRTHTDTQITTPANAGAFTGTKFSPDGRHLATGLSDIGLLGPDATGQAALIDTTTGTLTLITERGAPRYPLVSWSPDSKRIFIAQLSTETDATTISEYDTTTKALHTATLPIGTNITNIAVAPADVHNLFPPDLTSPDLCPRPVIQPSGRTQPCAYRF